MGASPVIFLSWSGNRSRAVAEALREWLPDVVQSVQPWMSAADIEKGSRWEGEISGKLDESNVGIVCLTAENLASPWLLFEAGALSKKLSKARVCTYLLGVRKQDVRPPLGMFQHTVADKNETRSLVETINNCQEKPVPEGPLRRVFERMWPDLEQRLAAIPKTEKPSSPARPQEDVLAEILETTRRLPEMVAAAVRSTGTTAEPVNLPGLTVLTPLAPDEPDDVFLLKVVREALRAPDVDRARTILKQGLQLTRDSPLRSRLDEVKNYWGPKLSRALIEVLDEAVRQEAVGPSEP